MQTQQKTPTPRFCHQLTVIVATIFLAGFTATLIQYRKLPATIPVLQSFTSDHAQFGPKIAIFYLPFIALMLFLLLHYLEMKAAYPMMRKNKPPLSHSQRQNGIMTFCLIKNSILLYFTYSLFNDLTIALGRSHFTTMACISFSFLALWYFQYGDRTRHFIE